MRLKFADSESFYTTFSSLTEEETAATREMVLSGDEFDGFEVAYSYFDGCIIMRYYSDDAGYHFEAPMPIRDGADVEGAYVAISEYCVGEAIVETVVGIPPEELDYMLRGADRYSLAEDEDGTLAVRIITECMECEFMPETMYDDVYLGEFASSYAPKYEKMLKDANLNCHFGYNILDDIPNGTGMDFIENARAEFERSESITLAATVDENGENVFVGEGVLYAFDGRGKACVSFRVLPEYHRRGIGRKIFSGLLGVAKQIGLKKVVAEVKKENLPSLNLLFGFAEGEEKTDKIVFEFDLGVL